MKARVILLVEDDYVDVVSVQRALKRLNTPYILHVAHNGSDALAMLTGNTEGTPKIIPDIILLDINMPRMNGLEFLRIIKNYYTLNNIKVFVTTTSAEEYDRMAFEQLGIAGYILKPLDFDSLQLNTSSASRKLMEEIMIV